MGQPIPTCHQPGRPWTHGERARRHGTTGPYAFHGFGQHAPGFHRWNTSRVHLGRNPSIRRLYRVATKSGLDHPDRPALPSLLHLRKKTLRKGGLRLPHPNNAAAHCDTYPSNSEPSGNSRHFRHQHPRTMKSLPYRLIKGGFYLLSLLPFRILYTLSDLLYIITFHFIRYRRHIVEKNLRNSFPDSANQLPELFLEFR